MLIVFKVLLFAGLLVIAYTALFQIRQQWFHRILLLTMGMVVATFIVVPSLSTAIAHGLGIGRGADLVFYFSHMLGAYLAVRLFQRQIRLEEQITQLVRALAESEARIPEEIEEPSPRLRVLPHYNAPSVSSSSVVRG